MIHWMQDVPPQPPYIASIFHYYLSDQLEGYREYDDRTLALVKQMPGFLGYESFRHDGRGSFISYWTEMEAVRAWAGHPIHVEAKQKGKSMWYRYYHSMLAEVTSIHSHNL